MYILLWPEDGRMSKEDVRGVFEGSIFYTIAEQQKTKQKS
jgi:peroxygenase